MKSRGFSVDAGNLLVIITVLVVFSKPIDVTNLFIVSLACADFLVATLTSPFQVRLIPLLMLKVYRFCSAIPVLADVPDHVQQQLAVPRLRLSFLLLQLLHLLHVLRLFPGFNEPRKVA